MNEIIWKKLTICQIGANNGKDRWSETSCKWSVKLARRNSSPLNQPSKKRNATLIGKDQQNLTEKDAQIYMSLQFKPVWKHYH